MATTLTDWRPSLLPAVCPPVAVSVAADLIESYIGTPAARAAEGAAMSGLAGLGSATLTSLTRSQRSNAKTKQADKAKGFQARGNPPRGRHRV